MFDLVDLTGLLVYSALDSNEADYEDGLIRAAAEALQVDAVVSYDKKAFKGSYIPRIPGRQQDAPGPGQAGLAGLRRTAPFGNNRQLAQARR